MSSSISLTLNPVPGFCLKSNVLTAPQLKLFLNIAWDANVPPPPTETEDVIQKAMRGEDVGWFVPVIVSDLRHDKDKVGRPALVVDCVFNTSIKSRTMKEPDFKAFIIELALQRVESQTSLLLSRQIGTPNIASKGKPVSRQVLVPELLFPPHHKPDTKSLVQELASTPTVKGISTPTWSWSNDDRKIRIIVNVPNLVSLIPRHTIYFPCFHGDTSILVPVFIPIIQTHAHITTSTLDVEPRRVILHVPSLYDLDINFDLSPTYPLGPTDLKRFRDLDVDGAKAEWIVAEKVIVLLA
ncbi:pre-RNA processing PIH1/Nop17-domain-containing protein [Suillus clintonianus]|uniref:pre-RNA processing PIH1/Nop17-domain-containing protein n=1 Tax=Suillus clintonianus TaxID=1904413 RepID=UPI001B877B22|nr:pre-RNA processing PIH1/Nop17-domain-containing protein [Suillus clintonianus]KAG2152807.1 pre-RNA processing PIH1/Nop17-domain-containing protein [Suillus clintonianus]